MATVESYETSSGQRLWRSRYRDPQRRSKAKAGFARKRDAVAYGIAMESQKQRGDYVDPDAGRATVGTFGATWLEHAAPRLKQTTLAKRESTWSYRVAPRWADVAVGDVRPSVVRAWVAELHSTGVGAPSIEAALDLLRAVLADAVEDHAIPSNPTHGIKPPRSKPAERGYLTWPQVLMLAEEVGRDYPQYSTVVLFQAAVGLRWGEMAALRVGDVDMLRRRVFTARAVAEVQGRQVFDLPKTHRQRSLAFPRLLAEPLAKLMENKGRDDLIFTGPKGHLLAVSRFRPRVFAPAVARCRDRDADFPLLTPHDLRHTAASLSIRAGANVKAVQSMLGHASASMTLDTYAALFPDDLDTVAVRLDESLNASVQFSCSSELPDSVQDRSSGA